METYTVTVERITFSNPDNGYCVLRLKDEDNVEFTGVGIFPPVSVGACLCVGGDWVNSKWGRQLKVSSVTEGVPTTEKGVRKYLSSGLIKGIGPTYADRIVSYFGKDTLHVLDTDIDRLREVPGIGRARVEAIRASWEEHRDIKVIMVFLQGYGLTTGYATKIYKTYGKDSIRKVQENPYRLADEIWGIGFKMADALACAMGFKGDDPHRVESGVLYTLEQEASIAGHVFLPLNDLVEKGAELLAQPNRSVYESVVRMVVDRRLVADGESIYLPRFFNAESGVFSGIVNLVMSQGELFGSSVDIPMLEGTMYDEVQVEAIRTAVGSRVMVLTGGPGTGKTTTVRGIISTLEGIGESILLAAPTGRAAKRMTEATGRPAKTIHRLLEYSPSGGYGRGVENPLEGDTLIVDECSMIDIQLMNSLLKAVPHGMRLILVGDVDQLPSVGAGNVLRDIIGSGAVTVVKLQRVFRQALTSNIVCNAHRINTGRMPDISNSDGSDFIFIESDDPEEQQRILLSCATGAHCETWGIEPKDIQVLTPMRKGPLGTVVLNEAIQSILNPSGAQLVKGTGAFRVGDRVMQLRNNYQKDVFNGDTGVVVNVDAGADTLVVDFDGTSVEYARGDLDELVLSYACTIHKSQGSEYGTVVIPVTMGHYVMLQRNLIYTAVTRAKGKCILVGTRKALSYCVMNNVVTRRNSNLEFRLYRQAKGFCR